MAAGFCCANTVRAGARPCRRAMAAKASDVWRAGYRRGAMPPPNPCRPYTKNSTPAPVESGAKRVWLAAPSSPNCGAAGKGSCTVKCAASAKIARRTAVVVGASSERWKCAARFAGVKCTRPSAVSGDGLTVAALATHIAAADEQAASSAGASVRARRRTAASSPAKPSARNAGMKGRSCGGRTACGNPRAANARILASPCSAASRGLATSPALCSDATFPVASPE